MSNEHEPTCPSCGTPWSKHVGLDEMCSRLKEAASALNVLGRQLTSVYDELNAAKRKINQLRYVIADLRDAMEPLQMPDECKQQGPARQKWTAAYDDETKRLMGG